MMLADFDAYQAELLKCLEAFNEAPWREVGWPWKRSRPTEGWEQLLNTAAITVQEIKTGTIHVAALCGLSGSYPVPWQED
jgi:hypothetical protein